MYKVMFRKNNRERRKLRVRKKVYGTAEKPRLSVFRSLNYIYAQLIDDRVGRTLVDISDVTKNVHEKGTKSDAAFEAGKILAQRAGEKNIKSAVFDRSGYKYSGRVKRLAEGAREGGLIF